MGTPPQAPPPPPQGYGAPQQQGHPGMAIAGFVVGLLGLILFWVPYLGALLAIVGLVLSILGLRQANERNAPKGFAIAGLVCSILGALIGIIWTIAFTILADETDDALDDLNEQLESSTTFEFNGLVIGLWMLRDRVLQPVRRLRG
jgi:hypothetical protein